MTVHEAIDKGEKIIALPSKIIFISATVLCVLLLMFDFSWLDFLLLPLGILLSFFYTLYVTPRWRIWAYERVADIHQLQRSAELAGLLMRQSHEKAGGFMSRNQWQKLKVLQTRFLEEPVFIDDSSIPDETPVYAKTFFRVSKVPSIVLNNSGIQVQTEGTFEWNQIEDERIAKVSYSRRSVITETNISAGSKDFFRFKCPPERFEIPLSTLNITAWKLDLLCYIYRGRFTLKQNSGNYRSSPHT